MRKIIVCGSRDFSDEKLIRKVIHNLWYSEEFEMIHGDADGADRIAKQICIENGIPQTPYPAEWEKYGRKAGVIRNSQMVNENPKLVVVFFSGKRTRGTQDTINKANRKGITALVYGLN